MPGSRHPSWPYLHLYPILFVQGLPPFLTAKSVLGDMKLEGLSGSLSTLSTQMRKPMGPRRGELSGPGGHQANCSCPTAAITLQRTEQVGLSFLRLHIQAWCTQAH